MADPASVKARLLTTFRDFRVDGVPASGANEPDKGEIRASLAPVVDLAQEAKDIASLAGSTFVVAAKSELASLSPSKVGDRAEVRNDPAGDVTNGNGVYRWTGAAWAWVSDLLPASVDGAISRAALGEASGDDLDTPFPVVAVEVDEEGKVVLERLADGRIDLEPGPRLLAKMGALGASGINNLAADSIIAARDVIGEDRRRVWSDADTQPLWRYSIRKDAASLGTAVPAVSYATLVIWYGQSNAEGNSGGEVVTTSPPSPRRALMLSTGVRGTGTDASNAAGIPDLLPAREVVTAASPLLGESPATSMMASLIARDGNTVPTLYVGRVPAKGGYRVDQLASGTVPFTNMVQEVARISALLALHKITDLRVVVSYLQGETDAVSSTPAATYKATLSTLLTAIRTQLAAVANVTDVKIVLCQAATNALSSIYPNDPAAMQYEIARDDTTGKVFLGEPNYQFPLSSQPSDNYHTSAAAKVALGRKTARTYKRALAGQRTAVMPNQATVSRVGNTIIIPFDTPDSLDLAIDLSQPAVPGLGFAVFDGAGVSAVERTPQSVAITGPRQVTIRFASPRNRLAVWTSDPVEPAGFVGNPVGMTKTGDAAAILSVVSDTIALTSAGLNDFAKSGKVYKLDNTAGTTGAGVVIDDRPTDGTGLRSISLHARGSGAIGLTTSSSGAGTSAGMLTASYSRRNVDGLSFASEAQGARLNVQAGGVVYFILPKIENAAAATPWAAIDENFGPLVGNPVTPAAGWEVRYAHDGNPVAGWLGARGTLATVPDASGDRYHAPVFIHVLG